MCWYLQQVKAFIVLRHAIHYSDIGLIHQLINPLSVWFYRAKQSRYRYEILYLRWLFIDQITTAKLQQSILALSLVNLVGRPNTFKAIDLALEHINCCYAINIKLYKNSIYNIKKTFRQVALASLYIS